MEEDQRKSIIGGDKSEKEQSVLRMELSVAVVWDMWLSYLLQLTFIENHLCAGNTAMSKT